MLPLLAGLKRNRQARRLVADNRLTRQERVRSDAVAPVRRAAKREASCLASQMATDPREPRARPGSV